MKKQVWVNVGKVSLALARQALGKVAVCCGLLQDKDAEGQGSGTGSA